MFNETHFRKLESMYLKGANINTALYETITLLVSEGSAFVTLAVS